MINFLYIFITLVVYYFLLSVFYLTGSIILRSVKLETLLYNKKYTYVFSCLLAGVVFFTTLFSVIISKFQTINILFILIGYLIYRDWKLQPTPIEVKEQKEGSLFPRGKDLLTLSFPAFIIFLWALFMNVDFEHFMLFLPHEDIYFYSAISDYLFSSGFENIYLSHNLIGGIYQNAVPYHYFELWLNSFVNLFVGNSLTSLLLVTIPLLIFIVYVGILSIIEYFRTVDLFYIYFGFFFLGTAGLMSDMYINFVTTFIPVHNLRFIGMYTGSAILISSAKAAPYLFLFIASSLIFLRGYYSVALLLLSSLMITSFASVPSIFGGITLFCIFSLVFGVLNKKEVTKIFLHLITITFLITLFYKVLGGNVQYYSFSIKKLLENIFTITSLKVIVLDVFVASILQIIIVNIIVIPITVYFLFFHTKKSSYKNLKLLTTFYIFVILSASLAWSLLYLFDFNAFQLFLENAKTPFFFTTIFVILLVLNTTKNFYVKYIVYFMVVLIFGNKIYNASVADGFYRTNRKIYSEKYIKEIYTYLDNNNKGKIFGAVLSNYDGASLIADIGIYLSFRNDIHYPFIVRNQVLEELRGKKVLSDVSKPLVMIGAFHNFAKQYYQKNSDINLKLDFIKKHNLNYLVLDSKQSNILDLVKSKFVIKKEIIDKKSGERFIFF